MSGPGVPPSEEMDKALSVTSCRRRHLGEFNGFSPPHPLGVFMAVAK
jgi:hypothetical protein